MAFGIMITNGGPHPADYWAETTAERFVSLVQVAEGSDSELARAARADKRKFRETLITLLEGYHDKIQKAERAALKQHGHARLTHDLSPREHQEIEHVADAVIRATKGTVFEEHFKRPDVRKLVEDALETDFRTVMFIDRDWHAAAHPHTDEAKHWRRTRHGHSV